MDRGYKKLLDMKQYHIDRDDFVQVINETIGCERLNDAFCYGWFNECDEFSWWRCDDEFYILHKPSGMLVNWYKHFGRTNTCSQENRTLYDYYEFFNAFKEEFKYWSENKGYYGRRITDPVFVSERKTALKVLQDLSKDFFPSFDLFGKGTLVIHRDKFEAIRKKYLD